MLITHRDLPRIREQFRRKKIVFCSGSFDIPHAGHILFFEDCKKHGDILVVGVGNDAIIKKNKGGARPVLNEYIRLKTIDSFKPVDFCFLDDISEGGHPLLILEVALDKLRPDVYVITEEAFDMPFRQRMAEKFHVELKILKRWCHPEFEEISTTKIVDKIKKLI